MKNICFFNSTKFWGGGEKLHLEYAERFHAKEYKVFLATKQGSPLEAKSKSFKLPILHVGISNLSVFNPFKIIRLTRLFKANAIDTLFFSTSQDAKAAGIAAKRAGVKRIVYLRGLAVPIKKNPLNAYLLKNVYTHLLVNSKETARTMKQNFDDGFPDEKIKVIYHGIELEQANTQNRQGRPDQKQKKIIIGNAGRLTQQKGQHLFIDIAKEIKAKGIDFKIQIAGTGDLEEKLKKDILEHNLQSYIEMLGFVPDIGGFMRSIDIFALTSLWEGFGYVIVEAMAEKKPVVAFDISSNPEIISNNETGYLVPVNDTKSFAEKLLELIQNDDLREKMGLRARKSVEERFELNERIDEIEAYLKQ